MWIHPGKRLYVIQAEKVCCLRGQGRGEAEREAEREAEGEGREGAVCEL